jgi:hypothetical protein
MPLSGLVAGAGIYRYTTTFILLIQILYGLNYVEMGWDVGLFLLALKRSFVHHQLPAGF